MEKPNFLTQVLLPKKNHKSLMIRVLVSSIAFALFAIFVSIHTFMKKLKNSNPVESQELELGLYRYFYQELKQATKGFRDKELLGQSGFGPMFKGTLPNLKTEVVIKLISNDSKQGLLEFMLEIASIGRFRHRNLVQLLGWCRLRGNLLLVYDFMENGSLENALFDQPKTVLSWEQRLRSSKGLLPRCITYIKAYLLAQVASCKLLDCHHLVTSPYFLMHWLN